MTGKRGFVLGDHQFLDPSESAPLSRRKARKGPIRGAIPPTYLDALVRESTPESPAAKMPFKGEFCGHGESTMTIFDVVIDGVEVLVLGGIVDDETAEQGRNAVLIAARNPGGKWVALFRREWEDAQAMLTDVQSAKVTAKESREMADQVIVGPVSIGFEYPCDADSRDAVSWVAIDILEKGKRKPRCVVSAELA